MSSVIVTFLSCYIVETMATSQLPANFYSRQGRIETGPGILIIDARWEFVVNRANKEKTTFWLYCKHRKTKGIMCTSKATVGKIELDGDIRYVLIDYTDEHKHPFTMGHAISEDMKFERPRSKVFSLGKILNKLFKMG